jgi:type VI secretion system protein ImpC
MPANHESRVCITFDVHDGNVIQKKELPFVVGVLADLSGHPKDPLVPFDQRKAFLIDRDKFNETMERAGTRLALRVSNKLTDSSTSLAVELNFRRIDDFEPTRVAGQIGPLKLLLEVRQALYQVLNSMDVKAPSGLLLDEILASTDNPLALSSGTSPSNAAGPPQSEPITTEQAAARLLDRVDQALKTTGSRDDSEADRLRSYFRRLLDQATQPGQPSNDVASSVKRWIAEIDGSLSAQLNEVMHHPDFQKLEGTWHGLQYLVSHTETGENLKIRVLNVSKKELLRDQEQAVKFDESTLFKKIHDEQYGWLGGEPYALLVGDCEFSYAPDDLNLLKKISQVAAAAHAPFVAAASPKMFGLNRFDEFVSVVGLPKILDRAEYAGWKSFRATEDSRFTALTVPRVLSRLPYGASFKRVEQFNFEENVDGPNSDKFAWMSSAWAYAARVTDAAARWGWMARIRGLEGGGRVEGLPLHTFGRSDGGIAMECPAEIAVSERHEADLSHLGFLPLFHDKATGSAVFMGAQSCHKPQQFFDAAASAAAELSAKLSHLLCASRFMHYLRIMARDKIDVFMSAAECEAWLNDWIRSYCERPEAETGSTERPLSDARVQIQPATGKPGWHKMIVDLVPFYQVEDQMAVLRLVTEIPRRG